MMNYAVVLEQGVGLPCVLNCPFLEKGLCSLASSEKTNQINPHIYIYIYGQVSGVSSPPTSPPRPPCPRPSPWYGLKGGGEGGGQERAGLRGLLGPSRIL